MNHRLFALLIGISSSVVAMEEAAPAIGATAGPELQLHLQEAIPAYIGMGQVRDQLEQTYGKKFPLNEPFFRITFANSAHFGFHGPDFNPCNDRPGTPSMRILPGYIPFSYISETQDNDKLTLSLHGKDHIVRCKQGGSSRFEQVRGRFFTLFLTRLELLGDNESLLREKVITEKRDASGTTTISHGPNNPFLHPEKYN